MTKIPLLLDERKLNSHLALLEQANQTCRAMGVPEAYVVGYQDALDAIRGYCTRTDALPDPPPPARPPLVSGPDAALALPNLRAQRSWVVNSLRRLAHTLINSHEAALVAEYPAQADVIRVEAAALRKALNDAR
jgi:hypothetical protein